MDAHVDIMFVIYYKWWNSFNVKPTVQGVGYIKYQQTVTQFVL